MKQVDNRRYLFPEPSGTHELNSWEKIKQRRYAFIDQDLATEMFKKVADWHIHCNPLESVLLVVEALKNSCLQKRTTIVKNFFKCKGPMTGNYAATILFTKGAALTLANLQGLLDESCTAKSANPSERIIQTLNQTLAYCLLQCLLDLFAASYVIETRNQLIVFKKRDVDFEEMIFKVR